jgi:class 3 adenylate cyclase
MAIGMRDALEELNRKRGYGLEVRIGINSGPVVAGVIGKKKFIYDLWGDTVNTASRMESHGVKGSIHVTEATAALLRGRFELEARGTIEVKGKGEMPTYLVLAEKRAA